MFTVFPSIDFASTYQDVRDAYDNVEKWAAIYKPAFNLSFYAMSPKIRPEPKGTILVIAPFNGPIIMLMSPLVSTLLVYGSVRVVCCLQCPKVGAIAGGNAAVLKPSEQTPITSALFAELVPKYLDNDLYHVINGGVPETTRVLELQWDHSTYSRPLR